MTTFIADSATRVARHTRPEINRRIADETSDRLRLIGDDPGAIRCRLDELDREWEVERVVEAWAATAILAGATLTLTVNRRFFAIPVAIGAFLGLFATRGWVPPLPLIRRLGFRTAREIAEERRVLVDRLQAATTAS